MNFIFKLFCCRSRPPVRTQKNESERRARTTKERLSSGTRTRFVARLHEEIGDHS
jgi:hypothetical protein